MVSFYFPNSNSNRHRIFMVYFNVFYIFSLYTFNFMIFTAMFNVAHSWTFPSSTRRYVYVVHVFATRVSILSLVATSSSRTSIKQEITNSTLDFALPKQYKECSSFTKAGSFSPYTYTHKHVLTLQKLHGQSPLDERKFWIFLFFWGLKRNFPSDFWSFVEQSCVLKSCFFFCFWFGKKYKKKNVSIIEWKPHFESSDRHGNIGKHLKWDFLVEYFFLFWVEIKAKIYIKNAICLTASVAKVFCDFVLTTVGGKWGSLKNYITKKEIVKELQPGKGHYLLFQEFEPSKILN